MKNLLKQSIGAATLVIATLVNQALAEDYAMIQIDSGEVSRAGALVSFVVSGAELLEAKELEMRDVDSGHTLPVQADTQAPNTYFCQLDLPFPAGQARVFILSSAQVPHRDLVSMNDDGEGITIEVSEDPVLRYNYLPFSGIQAEDPSNPPASWQRSGNIHPIWSPAGKVLSEIHAKTHGHHLGLWGGWVRTTYLGIKYDFWNLKSPEEKEMIQFSDWAWQRPSGPLMSGFKGNHEYLLEIDGTFETVMHETLEIKVFNSQFGCLFDYDVEQQWLKDEPLKLLQHRYGGPIAWRYPSAWIDHSGLAVSSKGNTQKLVDRDGVDGTTARWLKVHGQAGGQALAGFLIMSHPDNFRHPENLRLLHDGPNSGGYVHFTPIRTDPWMLEKGQKQRSRFRICTYDGVMHASDAELLWKQFATAPEVTVTLIDPTNEH